ncbi:AraC family transcriptional regulator [Myxococcus sp. K38C18041901]|uniref:AraC family transcriptional regulator n=1 Tax=Myxococcus guangdongensis TaxID=2906760 RepID=UPI0020A8235A|nr:AraC family transcriptional regulator [Myxococcus guangdongensis]MCP3063607.1 AraC family transcriptional regulator [Myxococcus guangdongensis]
MSQAAKPLSEGDIAACNVLPAFEASLRFGATEDELADRIGWCRKALLLPDARVSGASTYQHMELMFAKPRYAEFVIAAVRAYDVKSLGVVGLACKTMPNIGVAMACHARFQKLTNRTATYETGLRDDGLYIREQREDPSLGSELISDYTLLVAIRLLSLLSDASIPVRAMYSRRARMPARERALYEETLGAAVTTGAALAELVLEPGVLALGVRKADAEMEGYFRGVLENALPRSDEAPKLLVSVQAAIRDHLQQGAPTLSQVAQVMGLGERTLQRRLSEFGVGFQALLDDTRKTLAEGYLKQPELTLAEVAYLLGFVEQASFFRAFRRWYGVTPQAYRMSIAPR